MIVLNLVVAGHLTEQNDERSGWPAPTVARQNPAALSQRVARSGAGPNAGGEAGSDIDADSAPVFLWSANARGTPAAIPPDLVHDVQNLLDQNKFNEAYHRLVEDSSFLARVLASGVRKLPAGIPQAQRAMELANEDATMEMEHRTTYLATVGTLGPMIGLVGTVYGMIMAFQVIALEGSSPQASQLAAGISTALYATLEGIAISIPAIFFYAIYRNRIARLSLEVGMTAEPLLEQFAPGVRPAPPGPATSHGPAPTPPAHPHPFALSATLAATGAMPHVPALPVG